MGLRRVLRGLQGGLRRASRGALRGFEKGFKAASRAFKVKEVSRGLEGGFIQAPSHLRALGRDPLSPLEGYFERWWLGSSPTQPCWMWQPRRSSTCDKNGLSQSHQKHGSVLMVQLVLGILCR